MSLQPLHCFLPLGKRDVHASPSFVEHLEQRTLLADHPVPAFANWTGTGPNRVLIGGTVTTTASMPEHQIVTLTPRIDLSATNVASGNESFELKVDGKLIYKLEYRRRVRSDGTTEAYAVSTYGDGVS